MNPINGTQDQKKISKQQQKKTKINNIPGNINEQRSFKKSCMNHPPANLSWNKLKVNKQVTRLKIPKSD